MDIVESNGEAVKQSSASSQSQASSEVSVEKTATGSIESSLQQASSVQQSSSSVVQSSVSSSVSDSAEPVNGNDVEVDATIVIRKSKSKPNIVEASVTESVAVENATEQDSEDEEVEEEEEEEVEEKQEEKPIESKKGTTVETVTQVTEGTDEQGRSTTVTTVTTTTTDVETGSKSIKTLTTTKTRDTKPVVDTESSTPKPQNITQSVNNNEVAKADSATRKSSTPETPSVPIETVSTSEEEPITEVPVVVSPLQTETSSSSTTISTEVSTNDSKQVAQSIDQVLVEAVAAVEEKVTEETAAPKNVEQTPAIQEAAEETVAKPVLIEKPAPAAEIKQENIKNSLKEIISDIEGVIEKDEQQEERTTTTTSVVSSTESKVTVSESIITGSTQEEPAKPFTPYNPATEEQLPQKQRKLYASSAFFTPGLHPTVEDQFELARMISSSLCDSSNQKSKGQSMYVNRKKRSVKWVHEEPQLPNAAPESDVAQAPIAQVPSYEQESGYAYEPPAAKNPLRLVMNPSGQVHDIHSLQNHGFESTENNRGMLSPNKCAELVNALTNEPQGKGAELFAKRRKRSEKWIVDGTNNTEYAANTQFEETQTNPWNAVPTANQYKAPPANQYKEPSYQQPPMQNQQQNFAPSPYYPDHAAQQHTYKPVQQQVQVQSYQLPKATQQPQTKTVVSNSLRDLAYKPSIPQGWNAPAPVFSKDLYTPPEIPLQSYAVPAPLPPVAAQHHQQAPIYDSGFNYSRPIQESYVPQYQPAAPFKPAKYDAPAPAPFRRPLATANTVNEPQRNYQITPVKQQPLPINRPYQQQQAKPYQQPTQTKPPHAQFAQQPQLNQHHQSHQQLPPQTNYSNGHYANAPAPAAYNAGLPIAAAPLPTRSALDLNQAENYNRAARGWGQSKDYYRPITFTKPNVSVGYTDF